MQWRWRWSGRIRRKNEMNPETHNRYLGLAHVGYGLVNIVLMALMMAFFLRRWQFWDRDDLIFSSLGFGMMGLLTLIYMLPSFIAAWALLKRKPWAKTAAIVAGAVAAMYFPLGPLVTVYTFWFLFSEPGRKLYDRQAQALNSATTDWTSHPETEKAEAGSRMPDWR